MAKKREFALILCLALLLGGCGKPSAKEQPGEKLLTAVFTSDLDGRWDAFQAAGTSGGEATTAYFSDFSELCTENGLASLAANRVPYYVDQLAAGQGWTIVPEKITVGEPNESGRAEFAVTLSVTGDGKQVGAADLTGQIAFAAAGDALLVDSLWINDLSSLSGLLDA